MVIFLFFLLGTILALLLVWRIYETKRNINEAKLNEVMEELKDAHQKLSWERESNKGKKR